MTCEEALKYAKENILAYDSEMADFLDVCKEALIFVKDMQELALNTSDEFYGEVLCRKLTKHGFLKLDNGYYEVTE